MKVNLSLHQAKKTHGGVEVQFHAFLTSALMEASHQLHGTAAFNPGDEEPLAPLHK
jgi:hypothetical protein